MKTRFFRLMPRTPARGWSLLLQPVLSTSAILLLLLGVRLLLAGMVAFLV